MTKPTAVYAHYDRAGALLYVGISHNPMKRFRQHADKSRWADRVARVRVKWCASRSFAVAMEARAIRMLRPMMNVQGSRKSCSKVSERRAARFLSLETKLADFMATDPDRKPAAWAADFGVSRPFLYDLVKGERQPSLAVAVRIEQQTRGAVRVADWQNHAAVLAAVRNASGAVQS